MLEFDMSRVLVWFRLKGVLLELFRRMSLSFIVNGLGKPLYMDRIIAIRQKIDFVKVCVEVECSKEFPTHLEVELKNDEVARIGMEAAWLPPRCHSYGVFRHQDCRKPVMPNVEKKWLPRQIEEVQQDVGVVDIRNEEKTKVGRVKTLVAECEKGVGQKQMVDGKDVLVNKTRLGKEKVTYESSDSSGGRSDVVKGKVSEAKQSVNRFALLPQAEGSEGMEDINERIEAREECVPSLRKARAAMRPKRKSHGAKNKAKVVKAMKTVSESYPRTCMYGM